MEDVCQQLEAGETAITGVMVESNLCAGRQDVPPEGPSALKRGVSITDACVDWDSTVAMLRRLNEVRVPLHLISISNVVEANTAFQGFSQALGPNSVREGTEDLIVESRGTSLYTVVALSLP